MLYKYHGKCGYSDKVQYRKILNNYKLQICYFEETRIKLLITPILSYCNINLPLCAEKNALEDSRTFTRMLSTQRTSQHKIISVFNNHGI